MPDAPGARRLTRWTNASVRTLGSDDPVTTITARARQAVLDALDAGWTGPPFDPLALAELRGIEVVANSEVRDACLVPLGRGKARIEFNPNRPRGRMRYSVAHEIAHTLFEDAAEQIRNRSRHSEVQGDGWQLEALCNIAAAELLMPLGSLAPLPAHELSASAILDMQRRFDVSTEALVIRLAETSEQSVAAFCASPRNAEPLSGYRLDYFLTSPAWDAPVPKRIRLPDDSTVHQCTAIGYSARGVETWETSWGPAHVEAVGIPPYPGSAAPRVVGLLRLQADDAESVAPCIEYVFGDATAPRGKGHHVLVHIVNDKTPNWGGGGFASALRTAWPEVQRDFQDWAEHQKSSYRLGGVRIVRADDGLSVASVVAQHGYGTSLKPRLRYSALRTGLTRVAEVANRLGATVHMPRIGVGQAGGDWNIVRELIAETLCSIGLKVTVYELPGSHRREAPQMSLGLTAPRASAEVA